jgi:hypothetical protein
MSRPHYEGHSATVDLRLFIDGVCFDVAQVGEVNLILSPESPLPQLTNAKLVVTVDGEDFIYFIYLHEIKGRTVSFF